jgi:hypothetical protein
MYPLLLGSGVKYTDDIGPKPKLALNAGDGLGPGLRQRLADTTKSGSRQVIGSKTPSPPLRTNRTITHNNTCTCNPTFV